MALESLRKTSPLIDKLQLVSRPAKWCGRKKSVLKYPPIVSAGQKLGLSLPLPCESDQDWADLCDVVKKHNYNMIIAVSFGKLIPQKLLGHVNYSLNVHPSLLPRYKGASPIQYALLNKDEFTGVTIQTLDPFKFDHGTIVAQTKPLRVDSLLSRGKTKYFDTDVPLKTAALKDQLGLEGASLLNKVITQKLYENPQKDIISYESIYASKITAKDRQVCWSKETAETLVNKLLTIGALYTYKETKAKKIGVALKRVIFHKFDLVSTSETYSQDTKIPGDFIYNEDDESILVTCHSGSSERGVRATYIRVQELQFEGFKVETAKQFITSLRKRCGNAMSEDRRFISQSEYRDEQIKSQDAGTCMPVSRVKHS